MAHDEEPDPALAALEAEQRELLGEVDGLRRFIECMERLIVAAGSHRRETEVFELLEQVLDVLIRACDASDGSLLVPEDRTGDLVFVMVRGEQPSTELVGRRVPAGEGIAGWVASKRRAAIVNNVAADDRFYPGLDREIRYRTQSMLAAPLIGGGRVLGVVEVLNRRDGRLFTVGSQGLLNLMCRFAGEMLYALVRDLDLGQTGERVRAERAAAATGSVPRG